MEKKEKGIPSNKKRQQPNEKVIGKNLIKGSGNEYYESVKDMKTVTICDVFVEKVNRIRAIAIALGAVNFNLVDPDSFVYNLAIGIEDESRIIEELVEELSERAKDEAPPEVNAA